MGLWLKSANLHLTRNIFLWHRCLADTYLTNSSSHFLPRIKENKLRFQLDAFRFYREPNNQVTVLFFFCVAAVRSASLILTMTTVNFDTDLCDLLCEGGSSHDNCQLSEQGVFFNHEQVALHCVPSKGRAAWIWITPPTPPNVVFFQATAHIIEGRWPVTDRLRPKCHILKKISSAFDFKPLESGPNPTQKDQIWY